MNLLEKFKALESKQKITLVMTVFLMLVFIYLLYDSFFSKQDDDPTETVSSASESLNSELSSSVPTPINRSENNLSMPSLIKEPEPASTIEEMPPQKPTFEQIALLKESELLQQEYLKLLNQYQIAQLQQKLVTTNSAIATAKLKVLTTEVESKKIQKKSDEINNGDLIKETSNKPMNIMVSYVGEKRGQWIAMLKIDDGYFEVKEGTELPDHSTVDGINEKGVIIERNGEKYYFRVPRNLE